MEFFEHRLANGLQIVAERNPHVHSVAVGFFVRTGSRDETDDVSGVSHFLEHMAFKGTDRHSADDVNRVFDEVGAKYNASTSEETTLFYAAVLPEYLPRTFDLLADILYPALRDSDFDMEKKVILEEIGMYDDQPGFLVYERAMEAHFKGHPLGRSILGSNESITNLAVEKMREYHRRRYIGGNIVLAVAGNFDWPAMKELAEKTCGGWPAGTPAREAPRWPGSGGLDVLVRSTSVQEHVMSMCEGPSATDPLRHAAELLSVVIGDDTGSRFFWELVDPGLVESADLGYNDFDGAGIFMTYLCGAPEETDENLARIRAILDDVNQNSITAAELDQAKNKVLSRIVLRSERPMGRLGSLGHNWLCRGEYRPVEADLERYKSVTLEEIRDCLARYPLTARTTSAIGPCESLKV